MKEKKNLPISKSAQSASSDEALNNLKNKQRFNSSTKIGVGDFCELKVTALGPAGVGIDEFSYGFSILIPNGKLGETVKAQIIRRINHKKVKYAVAQIVSPEEGNRSLPAPVMSIGGTNLSVGDILTVKLSHITMTDSSCIGQASLGKLEESTLFIIPLDLQTHKEIAKVGQEIQIQVTKIKLKYVLAVIAPSQGAIGLTTLEVPSNQGVSDRLLTKGSKITLTLPKTSKKYAKHIVILLKERPSSAFPSSSHQNNSNNTFEKRKPYVLFLEQSSLGAKFGDKVRVKFIKIGSTFAIGKIVRIAPNSSLKKIARARKNLNEMLTNGMHYGEKVVKCQAKMRGFIWSRKKNINMPMAKLLRTAKNGGISVSDEKNSPLIKKGRHLINLLKTRRCLNIGLNQLSKYAAKGRTFLFVGTQKPAAGLIARAALFSKTSFFVNTRWLGGMLTNWKTITKSITKIRPILKEKQKVISNIMQKRAIIQNRLIKKVLSLRKKSKVLIIKGKQIIEKMAASKTRHVSGSGKNAAFSSIEGHILLKRKELFERGQVLLQKRQSLLNKQNLLKGGFASKIKENGFLIANKYKVLSEALAVTHKKLHDIRLLFILNKELRNISKLAKEQGKNQYTLSYGKFKELSGLAAKDQNQTVTKKLWLIPNPPQEILNKILITINIMSDWNLQKKSSLNKEGVFLNDKKTSFPMSFSALGGENMKKVPSFAGYAQSAVKEKNNASSSISSPERAKDGSKSIILTKLLSKFSRFLPYIKKTVSSMLRLMLGMVKKMTELKTHLKNLKTKLIDVVLFQRTLHAELKLIQTKYASEQQIIRILRRKLKRHEAEKKLLQFLPKLRYLPTPKDQIALAIQILMKRFVDPKMKYPMDLIYDEKLKKKSKKVAAARKKKWQRLETYFGGIANMTKLKKTQISNNVAIIIGQQDEMNAVLECKKLGIKMFHIVDTNCNPGLADHFIPSNDDSRNSIKYLLNKIVTRIRLAQKIRTRFKVLYKNKNA